MRCNTFPEDSDQEEDIDDIFGLIFETEEEEVRKERRRGKRQSSHRDQPDQQEIPLRLPTSYKKIVDKIQDKYSRRNTDNDLLIDINDLTVKDTPGKHLVNQENESDLDSYLSCDEDTRPLTPIEMTSHEKRRPKNQLVMYEPPHHSQYSLAVREPSLSSLVFDLPYQMTCLKELERMLSGHESMALKLDIEKKINNVLGSKEIPSPVSKSVLPFFTFDDEGSVHITFLFDEPPNTYWLAFLRNAFGSEYLDLQRQVYSLARSRAQSSESVFFGGRQALEQRHLQQNQAVSAPFVVSQTNVVRTIEPEDSFEMGNNTMEALFNNFSVEKKKNKQQRLLTSTLKKSSTPNHKRKRARVSAPIRSPSPIPRVAGPATVPSKKRRKRLSIEIVSENENPKPVKEAVPKNPKVSLDVETATSPPVESTGITPGKMDVSCPIKDCSLSTKYPYNIKNHLKKKHGLKDEDVLEYEHVWKSAKKSNKTDITTNTSDPVNDKSVVQKSVPSTPVEKASSTLRVRSMAETPLETASKKKKRTSITVEMDSFVTNTLSDSIRRSTRLVKTPSKIQ